MATTFNAVFYLQNNPDVAAAVGTGTITALQHFQRFGSKEGRNPNAFFNDAYYLAKNPDVAAAVSAGTVDALTHFATFGFKELRDANANFNTTLYLLNNPDVSAAVRAGLIDALSHWNLFGRNENRVAYDNSTPPKLIPAGTTISITIGTAQAGSTFNLTTGTDNLTGTTGADTFNGVFDTTSGPNGSQTTFNPLDSIKGGGSGIGTNTLALKVVDDTAGVGATYTLSNVLGPTVTSVQNINIQTVYSSGANAASTFVYNATNTTGATQWIVGGTSLGGVLINSIGNVASSTNGATVSNVSLLGNSGSVSIAYTNALLTGTADTLNLTIAGTNNTAVNIGNSTGSGFETVNLTASANGSLGLPTFGDSVQGAQTFNVSGAGNLTLGNSNAVSGGANTSQGALKFGLTQSNSSGTLNASTFTGNLNVAFYDGVAFATAVRDVVTVTGGSGSNRFNFGAGLNTSDVINGGSSGKNTLAISAPSTLVSNLQVSNIQVLEADALTGTYNVNNLNGGNVGVLLAGTGASTNAGTSVVVSGLFAAGPNNVTISGANYTAPNSAIAATLNVSGATNVGQFDTVNVTLVGTNTTGISVSTLTTTGVETLNLVSNQNGSTTVASATPNTISAISDSSLTAVNLTGAAPLSLTLPAAGTNANFSLNAASSTGNLTVVGSTAAAAPAERIVAGSGNASIAGTQSSDVIIGGSGSNTLVGGVGADTITGGSGKEYFRYTQAGDSTTTNGVDAITDFATARDKFFFATSLGAGSAGGAGFSLGAGLAGASGVSQGGSSGASTVTVTLISGTTTATSLDAIGNAGQTLLGSTISTTGTLAAAVVTVTSGSLLGTYLYINDTNNSSYAAGSAADIIINITGATAAPVATDFTFF